MNFKCSYKNPVKNRRTTKIVKFVAKLEKALKTNDKNRVGKMTLLLPFVSAKYPQSNELIITPIKEIALKSPFSVVFKFKSHATGITKLIARVSRIVAARIVPDSTIKIQLNLPNSKKNKYFLKPWFWRIFGEYFLTSHC